MDDTSAKATDAPLRPPAPATQATARRVRHPRRNRWKAGRYSFRRRYSALPKPFLGFGAFRVVMKGPLIYVVGPAGRACDELTRWARSRLTPPPPAERVPGARRAAPRHDPLAEVRRVTAAMDGVRELLDAVNWIHAQRPEVLDDLLAVKASRARDAIVYWLKLHGTLKRGRGRNAGRILVPHSADDQWRISMVLSMFRQLFDFWNAEGIRVGHNPMQMDPDKSRLGTGEKRRIKTSWKRWWLDVDSQFRVRHIDRQAPRPAEPDVPERVLARGAELGWPREVYLHYLTMHLTGGRVGQVGAGTAYGLLVAAKDGDHLALPQKGSSGALDWQARTPPRLRKLLLDLLATRVDGGLAQLQAWAKSGKLADHERLRRIYIFSPDGVAPTPTWKLNHLLRLTVESLGLRFKIRRDDGTTAKKWFTSHWFRHCFVNRILDGIAAHEIDEAARDRARAKLGSYLGWRNPESMLAYYGRHHLDQEVNKLVAKYQDDLNDKVYAFFDDEPAEGAEPSAANDNGIWLGGRVIGQDLLD